MVLKLRINQLAHRSWGLRRRWRWSAITVIWVAVLMVVALLQNCWRQIQDTRTRTEDLTTVVMNSISPLSSTTVTPHRRLDPFETMPKDLTAALSLILESRKRAGERATFVQIGANDGVFGDPLYENLKPVKADWIGLLVEPQPELHAQLSTLHSDAPDWTFYKGVFAPTCLNNGTIPFCETSTPGEGGWQTQGQTNSLNLGACERSHRRGDNMYRVAHRPCVKSFQDLIEKNGSPALVQRAIDSRSLINIDLLQIDVEGQDFELLKAIDFDIMMPQCIHYESRHLWKQRAEAREFLYSKGYSVQPHGMNTLACRIKGPPKISHK